MSGADKPSQSLIIPDTLISGREDVVQFPMEKGAVPSVSVASESNLGRSVPLQSGTLESGTRDFEYKITKAGGLYSGEFVFRPEDGPWRGTYDPRRFWGYQTPDPASPGSDNCSICYSSEFRSIVLSKVEDTTSTWSRFIRIKSEFPSVYGPWVPMPPQILNNQIASGHHSLATSTLSDGRLIAVVRTEDTAGTIDFDVYHSVDGGFNFTLVSEKIVEHFTQDGLFSTHRLNNQIRLAVSGEHVNLSFVNTNGRLITWLSRDRGITWQRITPDVVAGDFQLQSSLDVDDPYAFDLCSVDDAGTFFLTYIVDGSPTETESRSRASDGPWGVSNTFSVTTHPEPVRSITMVRTPDYIWIFSFYSDAAVGTNSGWKFCRSKTTNWNNFVSIFPAFPGWEKLESPQNLSVVDRYPSRCSAVWVGESINFYSALKDASTRTDLNFSTFWIHGGWDERSVGRVGPSTRLDQVSTNSLQLVTWNSIVGQFNAFPASYWEPVVTGTGVIGQPVEFTRFETGGGGGPDTAKGRTKLTPTPIPNPDEFGTSGNGMMWGFTAKIDPGSGNPLPAPLTLTEDGVGARLTSFTSSGGGGAYVSTVRISTDTIQHVCHGPVPSDSVIFGVDFTTWFEVRVSVQQNPTTGLLEEQVAVYNYQFGAWVVGAALTRSLDPAFVGWPNYQIGVLEHVITGVPQGFEIRDAWIINAIPDDIRIVDPVYPEDLFGMPLSPNRHELERGMKVSWGGAGAALGDTFEGEVTYTYAIERMFNSCPRIQFRSEHNRFNQALINYFSISRFNNFDWDLTPSAGSFSNTPMSLPDPFGVANNADSLRFSDALAHASVKVMENIGGFPVPYSGYTVILWGQSATPIQIGITVGGGPMEVISLDAPWQKYEFTLLAGATPGVQVFVLNYPGGGVFWDFSLFEFRVVGQTSFILDSHKGQTNDNRYNHNAASSFGSNCRQMIFDYSDFPDFSVASASQVMDSILHNTDATPLVVVSCVENQLVFQLDSRIKRGSLIGKYIRFTSGFSTVATGFPTWKVVEHGEDNAILVESGNTPTSVSLESQGITAGDAFIAFDDHSAKFYEESLRYRYVRVRIVDIDLAEMELRIGAIQIGRRMHIDVPLDWAFTDNEQPNVTKYRSRGAVTWAYNEGPPQRQIIARLVGDVEEYRDKLRFVQKYLQYETRALTLVLDDDALGVSGDGPGKKVLLARLTSGNQQDNSAWYIDENGVLKTAGDLSLTFEEEV